MKLTNDDKERIRYWERRIDEAGGLYPLLEEYVIAGELRKIPAIIHYFSEIVQHNNEHILKYLAHRAPSLLPNHYWSKDVMSHEPTALVVILDEGWRKAISNVIMYRQDNLDEVADRELERIRARVPEELRPKPTVRFQETTPSLKCRNCAGSGEKVKPIESLQECIAFGSLDWTSTRQLAWMYGIITGWGCDSDAEHTDKVYKELAAKFNWSNKDVAKLKALRSAFKTIELSEKA